MNVFRYRLLAVAVAGVVMTLVIPGGGASGQTATAVDPIAAHTTFNCSIRSKATGKYVTAELAYSGALHGALRARATTIGAWEKFQCAAVRLGRFFSGPPGWQLTSLANGGYVTPELGYTGRYYGTLRAHGIPLVTSPRYAFVPVAACSCYAIRSVANALYVSARFDYTGPIYGLLVARSPTIRGWEAFDIKPV
jgi:hypothetical protein